MTLTAGHERHLGKNRRNLRVFPAKTLHKTWGSLPFRTANLHCFLRFTSWAAISHACTHRHRLHTWRLSCSLSSFDQHWEPAIRKVSPLTFHQQPLLRSLILGSLLTLNEVAWKIHFCVPPDRDAFAHSKSPHVPQGWAQLRVGLGQTEQGFITLEYTGEHATTSIGGIQLWMF